MSLSLQFGYKVSAGLVAIAASFAGGAYFTRRKPVVASASVAPAEMDFEACDSLFHNHPDSIFSFDLSGRFTQVNAAAAVLLAGDGNQIRGRSIFTFFQVDEAKALRDSLRKLREGHVQTLDSVLVDRLGRRKDVTMTTVPMLQGGIVIGAFAIARDRTEQREQLAEIERLSGRDSLTNLVNRSRLVDCLEEALMAARKSEASVAVLLLDVDRFKVINDSLGHSAGDRLLRSVAERLIQTVREQDVVARMGGDEFAVIMPNSDAACAGLVAQRVLDEWREPLAQDGFEFRVTASIGISISPTDGLDAETLLRHADLALYRAKDVGRNGFQFYSAVSKADALDRLFYQNGLHKALENDEFVVHYQPQINTREGTVPGVEALVRWQHPERGLIPPADFIPVAEETGLIMQIGEHVMRTACAQNKRWQEAGIGPFRVAVNLSMLQFHQHNLVESVRQILADTGLDPKYLELEITESMAMHNEDYIMEKLHALKRLGIHISIDDFGTGYSSLGYLKKFPVDTLKIDRSFVQDITFDLDGAAIVSAVIAIARSLSIDVIAEGVELLEQLEFLQRNQCVRIQGYLFSPPVPAELLAERLAGLRQAAASASSVPAEPFSDQRVADLDFGNV